MSENEDTLNEGGIEEADVTVVEEVVEAPGPSVVSYWLTRFE